ncbi:cytochrome C oxidase subunit IV family protein [Mycobacterium sp. CVI_P3]|uniref:Cytochrome C oxidase subunit IV family protein n=1 Tax=Mycobacterium pinniadriaticum TaxID=2994102 RepID=A0ABT3SAG8_9MYCO|nr:cytochrome C oxidase subunit IV family protein [Mycobacterium pinniadriaticum]MCX2929979.1 cytochrome C oxidase subunit IV family protein [Mycobacterium pinniadriaticum]MCX2936372.1 cytochrome C oxidase subunit IV family protein [Mycobacterium pinniadriaticum]
METLVPLLRTRTTVVWFVLILATLLTWSLGGRHHVPGVGGGNSLAGFSILLIAFIKIRFIGMYFMELRHAPMALRGAFEAYCVVTCGVLIVIFGMSQHVI